MNVSKIRKEMPSPPQIELEAKIHLSASKSYGFHATHVGILNDEESRKVFNQVLKQINIK